MKTLSSLFLLLVCFFALQAQSGKVMDNLSMPSKILKGERKYAVYLPPDYETSQRSYPVLYLLHGGGDDQASSPHPESKKQCQGHWLCAFSCLRIFFQLIKP